MKYDQKILLNSIEDGNDAYNDFYASVSVLFRVASFIFLIAFLIFIVYSAVGSQEAFTYENLEVKVLLVKEKRIEMVEVVKIELTKNEEDADEVSDDAPVR